MAKSINLLDTGLKSTINIDLPSSKSISNRLIILDYLYKSELEIENLSEANDTQILISAIQSITNKEENIYVADCGTAMRFLISVLAITPGKWNLYGTEQMHMRSVAPLVGALRQIGAEINYTEKEGYPPLQITGKILEGGNVTIDGGMSSQFISSLMMVSGRLSKGLNLYIQNQMVSLPYIYMTLDLIELYSNRFSQLNIYSNNQTKFKANSQIKTENNVVKVEPDWTAASYWFATVAIGLKEVFINGLSLDSIQGDVICASIFKSFGVYTEEFPEGLRIYKSEASVKKVEFDFTDCPDLAQTIAVTSAILHIEANLYGLKNLVHKETNRIQAIYTELNKVFPSSVKILNNDSLNIDTRNMPNPKEKVYINTYKDHRMAMAFSLFSLCFPVSIEDSQVVNKSYPTWWEHLMQLGISVESI